MRRPFASRWLAVFCFALLEGAPLVADVRVVYEVDDAESLARRTGKPILAIAGTTN
jgi:hypothetical protein